MSKSEAHQIQGEDSGGNVKVTQWHVGWETLLQPSWEDVVFRAEPSPISQASQGQTEKDRNLVTFDLGTCDIDTPRRPFIYIKCSHFRPQLTHRHLEL